MESKILDKTASVIVIDSSGPVRHLLTETVRSFGFAKVQGLAGVRDALNILEVEAVDWIITPLGKDSDNALGLLKLCTMVPKLKTVSVSLLCEETERNCLMTAFELGLLSWHNKPFTKDTLHNEIDILLNLFATHKGNGSLVAASYLRELLKADNQNERLLSFEKSLLDLFPGSTEQLFNVAYPQLKTGMKDQAKATLRQIKMLDPSAKDRVEALVKTHFESGETLDDDKSTGGGNINVLGLASVCIVDSDDTIRSSLEDIFLDIGVSDVKAFPDGEAAIDWIAKNPNPGLIIQEWRIPKLTGPLFLQRAIAEGAAATPIILLSSLVKSSDMPLVKEMGVANIVEKPFDREEFLKAVVWTIQQDRMPSDQGAQERKVRNYLRAGHKEEAQKVATSFLANPLVPLAKKRLIEAELAYADKQYEKTRDFCIEAIKLAGDSILSLNLLGKSLMQLRDFTVALKCLEKAQTLSPLNIERLCSIAEVQAELKDEEKAKESMEAAADIDPDHNAIEQAEVKIAITQGDVNRAKELMGKLESLDNIVGYMNNKAVAMARCGMANESKDEYRKAINAVPDDRGDVKALLYYNLALAHVRSEELDDASLLLEQALQFAVEKIKKKSLSLKKRIDNALKSGQDFKLTSAPEVSTPTKNEEVPDGDSQDAVPEMTVNEKLLAEVLAVKGEIGCYLIFRDTEAKDENVKKLLTKLPTFMFREAIERAETLGVERTKKTA